MSSLELFRAFLIATNHVTSMSCVISVDELPSAGRDGILTEDDWQHWQNLLMDSCAFDHSTQHIQTSAHGNQLQVNNHVTWQSACKMHLENMITANACQGRSLCVYFDILPLAIVADLPMNYVDDTMAATGSIEE